MKYNEINSDSSWRSTKLVVDTNAVHELLVEFLFVFIHKGLLVLFSDFNAVRLSLIISKVSVGSRAVM